MNIVEKGDGQKRFFFHFNKPESKKQGRNVLTVHWKNKCVPVNEVVCLVPIETHARSSQPHCVVRGWCETVTIEHVTIKEKGKNDLVILATIQ